MIDFLSRMDWTYLDLLNGRVVEHGTINEANPDWPSFASFEEAEQYLEGEDIRANVVDVINGEQKDTYCVQKETCNENHEQFSAIP